MKKIWAFFLIIFLGGLFSPSEAKADVSCGSTLTTDTVLEEDLVCSGHALKIGADKIVVNLKGHRLKGDGTGIGIDNTQGFDYVVITRGIIEGFAYGISLTGAEGNILDRLEVRNNKNITGVEGVGILLWLGNKRNVIAKNKIHDNDRQGIYLGCNPFAFSGKMSDCEGKLAEENIIDRNEIFDNGRAGFDSYGLQLQFANNNLVTKNQIWGHKNWFFGQGIYVLSSANNLIERNVAKENTFGMVLWDNGFANSADGNRIIRNSFSSNDDTGIWILGGTFGTQIERNEVNQNGFGSGLVFNKKDGINALGSGVSLRQNIANNNFDYGIFGSGGVVDEGRNRASGNGNPEQCAGVVCL